MGFRRVWSTLSQRVNLKVMVKSLQRFASLQEIKEKLEIFGLRDEVEEREER